MGRTAQSPVTSLVLMSVTMLLLTVAAEPVGAGSWVWIALVPWIIASARARSGRAMWLVSYVAGSVYFLGNLYWLWPVTGPGMIGLGLYLGLYFPLCGFIFRQVYLHRQLPFTLVVPLVWVGQEFLRAWVFTGFPWFFLAHTQHDKLAFIQIADLFGAYGVSFMIAMANGLICDLLLRPIVRSKTGKGPRFVGALPMIGLTTLLFIAVLGYGYFRLQEGQKTMQAGPLIAAIQDTVPHVVKENPEIADKIFNKYDALSRDALAADPRPDLIVWPETMVPSPVNPEFVNLDNPHFDLSELQPEIAKSRKFDQALRELARQGCPLLVGTPVVIHMEDGDMLKPLQYNSAMLYLPEGQPWPTVYHKMHRVPFGEFVPFKKTIPWLYRFMLFLTPYDYDYSIEAGTDPVAFPLTVGDTTWHYGAAICYEDVIPWVPRRLAAVENGKKRVDFLLNLSTEGWYVYINNDGSLHTTAELPQHLAIARFRAVENRVGLVRTVNMGISAFIRPDGAIQTGFAAGSLPKDPWERTDVAGFITDRVYVDSRMTIYNRIGDVFAIACAVILGLFFLDAVMLARQARQKNKPSKRRKA